MAVATGQTPFAFETAMQAVHLVGEAGCNLDAFNTWHLSRPCHDFVRRATAWNAEERPSAAELLMHPFILMHQK